jgi:hypothetical protein
MSPESHPAGDTETHHSAGDALKQDASRLKHSVGERAKQEADLRKGEATKAAGSASSALNSAAEELEQNPEAPDWMASALQQAARKIESLSSHVDGRNVDELAREISDFARRNPGTFLAASAAVGLAAARVLRAGVDRRRDHHDEGDHATHDYADSMNNDTGEGWPADENIRPTTSGDFTPAYGADQTGFGSTTR